VEEVSPSGGLEQGPPLPSTHLQGECPPHQPAALLLPDKGSHRQTLALDGNSRESFGWVSE